MDHCAPKPAFINVPFSRTVAKSPDRVPHRPSKILSHAMVGTYCDSFGTQADPAQKRPRRLCRLTRLTIRTCWAIHVATTDSLQGKQERKGTIRKQTGTKKYRKKVFAMLGRIANGIDGQGRAGTTPISDLADGTTQYHLNQLS